MTAAISRLSEAVLKTLLPGDPAPWFTAPTAANPQFAFNSVAGRYIALVFTPSSSDPRTAAMLEQIAANRSLFDDDNLLLFGVTADGSDQLGPALHDDIPGIRWFFDGDREVHRLYDQIGDDGQPAGGWVMLDPSMRVIGAGPLEKFEALIAYARQLPVPDAHAGVPLFAPVLVVPRVFEPEFCKRLIDYYGEYGGNVSGFMRDVGGKTVAVHDRKHKRRKDRLIEDEMLKSQARARIVRRLTPEIEKAFQFKATRMERYLVACYEGEDLGHFRAHRDNTTMGTAHRKFAVTLNLNAHEYEGGELRFPEFGSRLYKPPTGGAVVFSCSLLHEARPVTKGVRYVFVPFLYDEEAARLREQNMEFVDDSIRGYRADAATEGAEA